MGEAGGIFAGSPISGCGRMGVHLAGVVEGLVEAGGAADAMPG